MKRFLKLPVVKPNTLKGATLVDCTSEKGPIGYPEGTQTHLFVYPQQIGAIIPGNDIHSSYIYLIGNNTAHNVEMPAEAVAAEVERFLANS